MIIELYNHLQNHYIFFKIQPKQHLGQRLLGREAIVTETTSISQAEIDFVFRPDISQRK